MPYETAKELFGKGNDLHRKQDLQGAALCYWRALTLDPSFAAASFNLGCTLEAQAGPVEALHYFARAARLRPQWCEARKKLALTLARVGRMTEAAAELEAAAALSPDDAGIRNNQGLALDALGRGDEAYAAFMEAIRLNPDYAEAHNNLAILCERYGKTSEAISCCLEALRLRPWYPEAHSTLASALRSQGRHAEAIEHLREMLRLRPDYPEGHSSLLFSLCYPAGLAEEEIAAEHFRFGAAHRFTAPAHENDPSPERIINVGYLSADFRAHAVSRFIEPVLRHHDRARFRITCYSNVAVPDARTEFIEGLADAFVTIAGIPDHVVFEKMRRDRIDILVDLSGHSAGNRLPLFARKPAPVQMTWLGYPHTTGLEAIDYRITDAVTDPPGVTESFYSEELLRLPGTFSCFAPPEEAPGVATLPLLANRLVTFGSFNNPAKITPETVALWAGVMQGVPGSRMLVKGYSLADRSSREKVLALFSAHGIAPERLDLCGNTPSYRDHLALYGLVDIALDTFPYNGTTTTCEALWMGVPVVTLCGTTHRSRVGASLLGALGLGELAARDEQGYRERGVELARDTQGLQRMRKTLRSTMAESSLTDGAAFTRELETAYRETWGAWCGGRRKAKSRPSPAQPVETPPPLAGGGVGERATAEDADLKPGAPRPHHAGIRTCALHDAPLKIDAIRLPLGHDLLREGKLDQAMKSFLAELRATGSASPALGGIEETLNRQLAVDRREALNRDAQRLGAPCPAVGEEAILPATLEDAAELLLAAGFITPADLICRYLLDRGHRSRSLSRTLGEVALAIGRPAFAAAHLADAVAKGDDSTAGRIALLKAEEGARLQPAKSDRAKFLLIKAWGYGFWSDVNHVLGQLLVAEITGRAPIVHWGGNSLFSDDPGADAFLNFFNPVSGFTIQDLTPGRGERRSFYPPKWNFSNIAATVNQADGPWSRCSSLHALERGEDVVVSDFHYAVHDLVPWIPPGHRLYGLSTEQVYLDLCRRYLKVRPAIVAKADAFFAPKMAGKAHLAVHLRGGDKGGEDPELERLNQLYQPEIERYLAEFPQSRLFLMTDDDAILSRFLAAFGERVVATGALRTATSQGLHYLAHPSRYRLGEEVIIDVLLALRCQTFIGNGLSNVSCAVAQMKEWAPGTLRLFGARLDRLRQPTLYRS